MLFGDPAKLFGILMGVTLAALVITQQGAIFCGIMTRSFSIISDMPQAEIWVMDPKVQFVDDTKPLNNTELYRVRSIEGVASLQITSSGQIGQRFVSELHRNWRR